ncbi:MAG: 3-isopropylmalate dehydratase [Candidatus Hydrogenedentota bacterium]|nr:MAG: 3-isopropylmalate dehydratase [Candidatus Hydrogenedentota bacterium]
MKRTHRIKGPAFVVGDNIDTDQIIPAKYLNLVPTIPKEYEELGRYALAGLPGEECFVPEGADKTPYSVIVAGKNFGCGSSREHAPIALGAAGCSVVVARSFARIFYRNCIATGEIIPVEPSGELPRIQTGDEVTIDLDENKMIYEKDGTIVSLMPLGEALPVLDAGGIFNYARQHGFLG